MSFALRPSLFSSHISFIRSAVTSFGKGIYHQHRSISLQSYVVTPKELNEALKKNVRTKISTSPRVIALCAAWFMPNDPEGRKGIDVFKQKRIPDARFFDLDEVSDCTSPYPHMLPSKERFAEAMQSLGIRSDDELVVYDTEELGLFSAPRVGWTLRYFGHPNVHILNNFRLWVREGYPVETGEPNIDDAPSTYQVDDHSPDMVVQFEELETLCQNTGKEGSNGVQILDARSEGRWAGREKEPRPELSSGHMPGSLNLPFGIFLDPETKALLPPQELRRVLEEKHVDPTRSLISSCGSGVSAAIIDLALEQAEYVSANNKRLYDGSWT
ncbi:hypothetical protein FQN57_002612 [Myotisia sp. PD_48]|nr:hypothetical protein FQN57_002612 [Myotisia sp. PD_48]